MAFCNAAEFREKDEEFWKGIVEWDIVTLIEIWIDKRRWKRIKERLQGGYIWEMQLAKRRNRKGRAMIHDHRNKGESGL